MSTLSQKSNVGTSEAKVRLTKRKGLQYRKYKDKKLVKTAMSFLSCNKNNL